MPCLSVKIENKLMNVLCRTCAKEQCKDVKNYKKCNHNEEERAIYGYFCDCEII